MKKEFTMKRILALILCVACIALVGCNRTPAETTGEVLFDFTPVGPYQTTQEIRAAYPFREFLAYPDIRGYHPDTTFIQIKQDKRRC